MQQITAKLVVTLPSGADPLEFARRAQATGADLLEIRDDLTSHVSDIELVASALPILHALRTERPVNQELLKHVEIVDQDISLERQEFDGPRRLLSFHTDRPLEIELSANLWRSVVQGGEAIKHVEPYEAGCELHLTKLRKVLRRFCSDVTVLAMGSGSEGARRLLSGGNSLHYCCLDENTASAPGQPLLADEVVRLKRAKGNK